MRAAGRRDGAFHGQNGSPVDVELVDLCHARLADRPSDAAAFDCLSQFRPQFRPDLLRIVEPFEVERTVEDDDRGHDRARQRATANFVGSGDEAVTVGPGGIFIAVEPHQAALFALAGVAAFLRRIGHAAASGGSSNVIRPSLPSPNARM